MEALVFIFSAWTHIDAYSFGTKYARSTVCGCHCVVLSVYFVGHTPQDNTKVKYARRTVSYVRVTSYNER